MLRNEGACPCCAKDKTVPTFDFFVELMEIGNKKYPIVYAFGDNLSLNVNKPRIKGANIEFECPVCGTLFSVPVSNFKQSNINNGPENDEAQPQLF